jgi:ankyrin repeat protein
LVAAVLAGDTELAALALDAGADPSAYDPETTNGPLSLAITRDDTAMVRLLVDAGAIIEWPEFDYSELQTAGTFAGAEVTQILLEAGARPDGVGASVGLPVFLAAYEGNLAALAALLEAGADPNLFSEDAPRPAPPIFGAAYGGSTDAVLMLIDAGADVTVRSPEGYGPADWADSQGHRELAELLRSFGG